MKRRIVGHLIAIYGEEYWNFPLERRFALYKVILFAMGGWNDKKVVEV